jgi:hypothetical protein
MVAPRVKATVPFGRKSEVNFQRNHKLWLKIPLRQVELQRLRPSAIGR